MRKHQKLIVFLSVSIFMMIGCNSKLPDNFTGKYCEKFDGKSCVEIRKDGSWIWIVDDIKENEVVAFGKYHSKHLGEWGFGPDSWEIIFEIEGGRLKDYFDVTQVIYYQDYNEATGEKNYYRLNGVSDLGAASDFYKF